MNPAGHAVTAELLTQEITKLRASGRLTLGASSTNQAQSQ
jgi:hypothetical protein